MIWLFFATIGFMALSTLLMNKCESASLPDDKQACALFAVASMVGAGVCALILIVWVLIKVASL